MVLVSSNVGHDGKHIVGFVKVGTGPSRAEFWNNRLAATDPPIEPNQTRIPEVPDQSAFLERWFEFHQGHRIVKNSDGTDRRIAVIGEPFREVSPGFLPRTLHQLRAGTPNDAQRPENRFRRRRLSCEEERPAEPHQNIEDALDALLEEQESDEEGITHASQTPQEMPRGNSILPFRQRVPPENDPLSSRPLSQAEQFRQRARERFTRVFGTREQIDQDDYESPLTTMFGRAEQRYREAAARRRSGDTIAPPLDGMSPSERNHVEQQILWGVLQDSRAALRGESEEDDPSDLDPAHANAVVAENILAELDSREIERPEIDHFGSNSHSTDPDTNATVPTRAPAGSSMTSTSASASILPSSPLTSRTTSSADLTTSSITPDLNRLRRTAPPFRLRPSFLGPDVQLNMDLQNRPPPLTEAAMTKTLSCQVCYSQLADIALLPCGHMVMCGWCADTLVPLKHGDKHLPARGEDGGWPRCPVCRKGVKSRYRIHV